MKRRGLRTLASFAPYSSATTRTTARNGARDSTKPRRNFRVSGFLDLFNLFLDAKQDRSPEYLKELRITRDRLSSLHAKLVCDISPRDLEPWEL